MIPDSTNTTLDPTYFDKFIGASSNDKRACCINVKAIHSTRLGGFQLSNLGTIIALPVGDLSI